MPIRNILIPAAFVLIWATGFIVARTVAPHAGPLTFLALRFVLAAIVLAGIAVATGARWPGRSREWRDAMVAGALLHGAYLGCVFWAVARGLPAGITSLIVGAQPVVTAFLARPLLGEHVSVRRWLGVCLGFAGLALVIGPRISVGPSGYPVAAVAAAFVGLIGITAGTIWQKRRGGGIDLRTGTALQYAAAALVAGAGAFATETMRIDPAPAFWLALAWAVFGLSIGAVLLLLYLLRHGGAVAVSSLLFLVPPVTMLMGYVGFGETLSPIQIAGMAVSAAGVALAGRA